MLASKHLNLTMGVDIHMVKLPPNPAIPIPMPHPFVGTIMDPMDYLPFLGTQVHINKQKRSNAGTTSLLGSVYHIPMGIGFHPAFKAMKADEGFQFFGSMTVKSDGTYLSAAAFNLMTCNCLGMPLGSAETYLPTTTSIPIPMGMPVMVGGPQVPDIAGVIMKFLMMKGMKFLLKRAGKLFKSVKCLAKKGCC